MGLDGDHRSSKGKKKSDRLFLGVLTPYYYPPPVDIDDIAVGMSSISFA
jgi:hypothetical protein